MGCDYSIIVYSKPITISTHTSRVGCDGIPLGSPGYMRFLLTHPVWDVTVNYLDEIWTGKISTHTSRVGCDVTQIAH